MAQPSCLACYSKSLRCNIRHLSPPNLPQFGSLQGKGGCCPFGLSLKAFSPFGEPARVWPLRLVVSVVSLFVMTCQCSVQTPWTQWRGKCRKANQASKHQRLLKPRVTDNIDWTYIDRYLTHHINEEKLFSFHASDSDLISGIDPKLLLCLVVKLGVMHVTSSWKSSSLHAFILSKASTLWIIDVCMSDRL